MGQWMAVVVCESVPHAYADCCGLGAGVDLSDHRPGRYLSPGHVKSSDVGVAVELVGDELDPRVTVRPFHWLIIRPSILHASDESPAIHLPKPPGELEFREV